MIKSHELLTNELVPRDVLYLQLSVKV